MIKTAALYYFNLLLITCMSAFPANAQGMASLLTDKNVSELPENLLWEEVYLQIDRQMYIAGEDTWFSIYAIDMETGKLSQRSIIVYLELLNPWNKPVIQSRFRLFGGKGEGNFLLPDSLTSGTYTIRAYTNWMKNFLPSNCFMSNIEIYNPFRNSTEFIRKSLEPGSPYTKEPDTILENRINLCRLSDSIFGRREKVTLNLATGNNNKGLSGVFNMSISVTMTDAISSSPGIEDYLNSMKVNREHLKFTGESEREYDFETEGHYLSGMVNYRTEGVSDSSDFLFMSIQGKVAEFYNAGIDSSGHFSFILPVDDITRNLILQPENANKDMMLDIEPSFSPELPDSQSFRDKLPNSLTSVFSSLSFNYQAAKIYNISSKKPDETSVNKNPKKVRFYGIPEMEIYLDDYIMLPTMQEVFFELLPGIIIRSRKTGYEILITNPLTGIFYSIPPLIMIDGVIINDLSVLVELNPETVEKIEVVRTPYLVGDMILYGIVNVITRSGDFSDITMPDYAVILPYRVVESPATFISPDYENETVRRSRKPDLRNTLYWNPSVRSNKNGETRIEFRTSDLPGSYTVRIEGISETGEKLSVRQSFIVR